ncbi:MAG TPA: LacI family transcriptional regulator [Firmicutes bacterium]|nr:LacI family transcriptional regulator [Bacillota bacterium]
MNIRKIAELAGVSPSTVSRVLNNTKAVSPEVKERVYKAIHETNYVPNTIKRQAKTVAAVIPSHFTAHGWSGEILDGILDGAGNHPVTLIRQEALGATVPYWQQQVRAGLKGVLFVATERIHRITPLLRQVGIPYVVAGRGAADDHWVWCDTITIVAQALEMLYQKGHRRIAFVGYPGPQPDHIDRLRTYRCYMEKRGLAPQETLLTIGKPLSADIIRFMDQPSPPTAVFVAGSNTAVFTLSLMAEKGIAVPDDLELAAIGPHSVLEARQPPLPLIQRQLRAGVMLAMESLLSLATSTPERLIQKTLPSRLVCGDAVIEPYSLPKSIEDGIAAMLQPHYQSN